MRHILEKGIDNSFDRKGAGPSGSALHEVGEPPHCAYNAGPFLTPTCLEVGGGACIG
jgi:hypothetical protein